MGPTGDYAGMSNDKAGENPARRKPKVSWGRQFRPGLAGALVEAERRRRWTAGQHSCAGVWTDGGTASRWYDGVSRNTPLSATKMVGLVNPPAEFKVVD